MIDAILLFSIRQRIFVVLGALALLAGGLVAATHLPIDAVPDITNKQIQINAKVPALGPEDVERQITLPLELALAGLPHRQEMRSISQFGLSQVTVVFEDGINLYFARQLVAERIQDAKDSLPPGVDVAMGPVTTGLGEIYHVVLENPKLSLMERRTLMDWVVAPQLRTVAGLAEVNPLGGDARQFQVRVDPNRLQARGLGVRDVFEALSRGNTNAGGAYLARGSEQQVVRGSGLIRNLDDIRKTVISAPGGVPIFVRDVAEVEYGASVRQGAATRNGEGEQVFAINMLLVGENGRVVMERLKDRLVEIRKSLPEGSQLNGFLDRSTLIERTLRTAVQNLVEGGLLVIIVLFLFLMQVRAGLIVSSAIPLAMLVAIIGMNVFGISANLMSLGAIDFGLIVDGAVIIVENAVRLLAERRHELGRDLTRAEQDDTLHTAASEVLKPAIFGMGIIIAAYLPILTLVGVEGKMFRPMGLTVIMALVGALVLSLTLIPALCSFFLKVKEERENPVVSRVARFYGPALERVMRHRSITIGVVILLLAGCGALFPLLGSEFIPELDEGAIALQGVYPPSISLDEVVKLAGTVERTLLKKFPDEIEQVATRIGRAEVATDPMLISQTDVLIPLKPPSSWKKAHTKEELVDQVVEEANRVPGIVASATQPIKMRMMELIEGQGLRGDVGIKLYGPDREVRAQMAEQIAALARGVQGAVDVTVETTEGLPLLDIQVKRDALARYGLQVSDVQEVIETALGGQEATVITEGNAHFPLVVRLAAQFRSDSTRIAQIPVATHEGQLLPLSTFADIRDTIGPVQVSRENGEGRTVIQFNVRGRDLGGAVEEMKSRMDRDVKFPTGYHVQFGGAYEKMQSGRARLLLVVPVTFFMIFLLLFSTFGSLKQAALVFTGIPFAVTGGILALFLRGMHFSMSAGIGFIALFGVAVLNGVVLVTFINELRSKGMAVREAVTRGCEVRLRPVLMTATVASIGFIPMALAHGAGAEVQKPLATVVIGGLLTSTVLTLFVLPTLYAWLERDEAKCLPDCC